MDTPFLRRGCAPVGCCSPFIHSVKRCLLQTAVTALKITSGPQRPSGADLMLPVFAAAFAEFNSLSSVARSNCSATFHCRGQFTAAKMTV